MQKLFSCFKSKASWDIHKHPPACLEEHTGREKKTMGTFVTQAGTGSRGRDKNRAQRSQQDDGPSGEEPGPVPDWNQFPRGSGEWEVSRW